MSTLVIEELRDTLSQTFKVSRKMRVRAIRPLLYLHNISSGTLTVTIKKDGSALGQSSMDMADIVSDAGLSSYSWGTFRFNFSDYVSLIDDTEYEIELSASDYSFSESSYVGWVRPHEDFINTFQAEDTILTDYERAFGFELWSYKDGTYTRL